MLKKFLLAFALMAGIGTSVQAQDIEEVAVIEEVSTRVLRPVTFSLGPKVDFNYAIAGNPEGMKIGMKGGAGFNAGLAANLRFGRPAGRPLGTERFGAQLEILYSMRNLNNAIERITMNGLEIPLLFQWYFIPQLAIEAGPTFTATFSTSPDKMTVGTTTYAMSKIKPSDVLVTVGLNCMLRNGFMAEFRYNIGTGNMASNFKTKVSTVSLGVGWLFNVVK